MFMSLCFALVSNPSIFFSWMMAIVEWHGERRGVIVACDETPVGGKIWEKEDLNL